MRARALRGNRFYGLGSTFIRVLLFFMMAFLPVNVTSAASSGERIFIDRWTAYDEMVQARATGPAGFRRKLEIPFGSLRKYEGRIVSPPEAGNIGHVLVLSALKDRSLLHDTPKNTLGAIEYLGEEFRREMAKCEGDRSWLVALPENTWNPIDLNPYCSMAYDESGIVIDLYSIRSSPRPLIDISTNGFKCVSHRLYGWDGRSAGYRLRAEKCTGSRPVENFSLNSTMTQVFPPAGGPQGKSGSLPPWSGD
jgi:hypothetical protein